MLGIPGSSIHLHLDIESTLAPRKVHGPDMQALTQTCIHICPPPTCPDNSNCGVYTQFMPWLHQDADMCLGHFLLSRLASKSCFLFVCFVVGFSQDVLRGLRDCFLVTLG